MLPHEVVREIGIVGEASTRGCTCPNLRSDRDRARKCSARHVRITGSYRSDSTRQDRSFHAFRMVGRHYAGEHPAKGQADQNCAFCRRCIHYGERIHHIIAQRVRSYFLRPVRLAVTATVIGDAAEAFAEIRQLRLVNPRVSEAPGRQEDHGLRSVAVNLVMELHAIAINESFLVGCLGAHDVTSSG